MCSYIAFILNLIIYSDFIFFRYIFLLYQCVIRTVDLLQNADALGYDKREHVPMEGLQEKKLPVDSRQVRMALFRRLVCPKTTRR